MELPPDDECLPELVPNSDDGGECLSELLPSSDEWSFRYSGGSPRQCSRAIVPAHLNIDSELERFISLKVQARHRQHVPPRKKVGRNKQIACR